MTFRLARREAMLSSAVVALVAAPAVLVAAPAVHARSGTGYRDPSLPIAARVKDLLARMTIEEKTGQMRSMWFSKSAIIDGQGNFSPEKAAKALANGIG